jgi:hypothetical protein
MVGCFAASAAAAWCGALFKGALRSALDEKLAPEVESYGTVKKSCARGRSHVLIDKSAMLRNLALRLADFPISQGLVQLPFNNGHAEHFWKWRDVPQTDIRAWLAWYNVVIVLARSGDDNGGANRWWPHPGFSRDL